MVMATEHQDRMAVDSGGEPPALLDRSDDVSHKRQSLVNSVVIAAGIRDEPVPKATETSPIPETEETPGPQTPKLVTMAARAYQLEMLEASLKENVIVAMDTGSGKTQVAVLRIKLELEKSDKIVWFLAPTVALVSQQYEVLQCQIPPSIQSRKLCGDQNVKTWQIEVWDAVLQNIRLVVSTYQVLFDAVAHAFVPLSALSLIVIDEAHNCVGRHPLARLMKEIYWPEKHSGCPVPHILGLTASPLMRSNTSDLEVLEKLLDSRCRTPSRHRDELLAMVNRPEMITRGYQAADLDQASQTPTIKSLIAIYKDLDITKDPYVLHLLGRKTPRFKQKLIKAIMTQSTPCRKQAKSFSLRAREICKQLGPWAADYYVHKVILRLHEAPSEAPGQPPCLADAERAYLAAAFTKTLAPQPPKVPTSISSKVDSLISILTTCEDKAIGIIFVKDRMSVAVLSHLLAFHPKTKSRYRVGSMVGTAKPPGRRQGYLDLSKKEDIFALQDFRQGKTNLLVATSVLEEGIDVPVCNLVICFDPPSNLKSFIQRRGRARMSASRLYLLVEGEGDAAKQWIDLEKEMKAKYEDEQRKNVLLEEAEESGVEDYQVLVDKETGARLTIHDAKKHLDYFCATLSARKFVDWSPYYVVQGADGRPLDSSQPGLRKATVHLPTSIPIELRRTESLRAWNSEATAYKDAAFQAYTKLYKAGLVNRHLLPIRENELMPGVRTRPGMAKVQEQFNPWVPVAQAWREGGMLYTRRMVIAENDGTASTEVDIILPVPVPQMEDFAIYWDHQTSWRVHTSPELISRPRGAASNPTDHSAVLLKMAFGHRPLHQEKKYAVGFSAVGQTLGLEDIGAYALDVENQGDILQSHLVRDVDGHPYPYSDLLPQKPPLDQVRRTYKGFEDDPEDASYAVVRRWSKRPCYFHQPPPSQPPLANKPYYKVLRADLIKVDAVSKLFTQIGMLIPAITRALEVHLVAEELLKETRLTELGITDLPSVVTAISATAARGPTDYERIEFVGDSILKLCATINCSAKYPHYPEGTLSPLKDNIVSNSRLSRASVGLGLDAYIVNKGWPVHKWKPPYVEDLLLEEASEEQIIPIIDEGDESIESEECEPGEVAVISETAASDDTNRATTRDMSTKTLADVVEALIGTAYVGGGLPRALACINAFIPEVHFDDIEKGRRILFDLAPAGETLPANMRLLEPLIGYTFTRKALLVEAMTHPSFGAPETRASLDRLEFIGDAILDYIVMSQLYGKSDPAPLANSELHLLKTALVNADVLAFFSMEWAVTQERVDVLSVGIDAEDEDDDEQEGEDRDVTDTANSDCMDVDDTEITRPRSSPSRSDSGDESSPELLRSEVSVPLWSFLRHSSGDMALAQKATQKRHETLRSSIRKALDEAPTYPWALLARLQAQKYYSDLFESLVGAVWVDSGSFEECEALLERAGILPLMRRFVRDKVSVMHPREVLSKYMCGNKAEYVVWEEEGGTGDGESGKEEEAEEENDGGKVVKCRLDFVLAGEKKSVVVDGSAKDEAKTRAAEEACRMFREKMGGKVLDEDVVMVLD